MDSRNGLRLYRCGETALVRAATQVESALPAWPDLTGGASEDVGRWCVWLREVWALDLVADAVEHASPVLARQVEAVCAQANPDGRLVYRTALSVARYALRMTGRATPFGLFAGVALVSFGPDCAVRWETGHGAIARVDASWISEVIARLESCRQLFGRLPLMANSSAFVRGDRLVV
ncbi:MAG: lantibiotic biosynthesis protein, partial [Micromonosporaceae bacterium]|nr:lantibiotic biosynthesis protein [Micromonosporaceae bacterium]